MKAKRQVIHGTQRFEDVSKDDAKALAMLIDCEGSISCRGIPVNVFHPEITVTMADMMPIDLAKRYGGYLYKKIPKNPKHKIAYRWDILKLNEQKSFLEAIKPFLQIKQRQALLALEMLNLLESKPENYKAELLRLKQEINSLNNRQTEDVDITKL